MNDRELEDALVGRLRLLSREEPDLGSDVRAAQRARLVAMAAVRTPEVRSPESRPTVRQRLLAARAVDAPVARWRSRLTAGLIGAAMTVGALSGLVALAQDAEPGDLLYGLKRGSEQTQLALASDADRGLTLLGFASVRLQELTDLTGSDAGAAPVAAVPGMPGAAGADAATVLDVLETMDSQTAEGTAALTSSAVPARDTSAFTTLAEWAAGQRAGLEALDVPAGAEQAVADSVALVDQVAARGAALQAALACPDGATDAGTDSLGPVPGACLAAPAPGPTTAAPGGTDPGTTTAPGTTSGQAPATGAPTTTTPAAGSTGAGSGAGSGGGAPSTTTPAVPTLPLPLPTPGVPTTTGPLIEVPLPLPSTTVCVGGLICVGG